MKIVYERFKSTKISSFPSGSKKFTLFFIETAKIQLHTVELLLIK